MTDKGGLRYTRAEGNCRHGWGELSSRLGGIVVTVGGIVVTVPKLKTASQVLPGVAMCSHRSALRSAERGRNADL